MTGTALQAARSVQKEGRRCSRCQSRDTPAAKVVLLQPIQDHAGADIHTAVCGGHRTRAGEHALKEVAGHGVTMLEQAPGGNCSLWRGARTEQVFQQDL